MTQEGSITQREGGKEDLNEEVRMRLLRPRTFTKVTMPDV